MRRRSATLRTRWSISDLGVRAILSGNEMFW